MAAGGGAMRARLAGAWVWVSLALLSAPAGAADINCDAFIDKLRTSASDLGVDFSHALVVSRARSDIDVFDITTKSEIDGDMSCRTGRLLRFEARMSEPATSRSDSQFEAFQAAALRSALGWEAAKARTTVRSMAAEAREYLKASRERGDIYISGKTEAHEPGNVSLGLIVTDTDTVFILIGAEQD
jgi:hypothetical protein